LLGLVSYLFLYNTQSKSDYSTTDISKSTNLISYPSIQSESSSSISKVDPLIHMLVLGDVNTDGQTGEYMKRTGANPFQNFRDTMLKKDLVLANLEVNISEMEVGSPAQNKPYVFKTPPSTIKFFIDSNLKAVAIANNHTMDYGPKALVRMMELLNQNNIINFGGGKNISEAFMAKYSIIKGVKFAFISVNAIENEFTIAKFNDAGTAYFSFNNLQKEIIDAKNNADIVIVMPHWGEEHNPQFNSFQKSSAHKFIDWGADIILGNHPHIVQGNEIYKGKYIFYSLGNFIASGFYGNKDSSQGEIINFDINNKSIENIQIQNVSIDYNGFPSLLN